MATDARISTSLPAHPKAKKLLRRLGAAGGWHLVCLFLWVAANRPDGVLAGMSDEDIELAADWSGDDGAFVPALLDIGFLEGDTGSRQIHDWAEHNPWAAGADMRSAKARWNSVKRHHGEAEANRQVPEYAAVRKSVEAPSDDAGSTAARTPDSNAGSSPSSNAVSMHLAILDAERSNAPSPIRLPSVSYPTPTLDIAAPGGAAVPKSVAGKPKTTKAGKSSTAWQAYSEAFEKRYRVAPVSSAKVNSQLCQLVDQIGAEDAAAVAVFYVGCGDRFYVEKCHPVDMLLKDCQKLRTLWATANSSAGADRHPQWVLNAGFANVHEARNEGCFERNAHEYRDGHRVGAPA